MPLASVLGSITDLLTTLVGDHGLYAVFALMLVDAILPAASEVVMVYAGAVAAGAFAGQDVVLFGQRLDAGLPAYLGMALAGTLGYTVGSELGWWIGARAGRPYLERHGRWLHLNADKLDRAERWFDRWEDWGVFLGRVTPVMRSFVSIPAGVFRAPLARYTVLTLVGSAIWAFAFAGIGWALGSRWEDFHHVFRFVDYAIVAALVAGIVVLVRKRRARRPGTAPDAR